MYLSTYFLEWAVTRSKVYPNIYLIFFFLFVCLFIRFYFIILYEMDHNSNFFHPNINPYFISFDLDITNPTLHNMNQPNMHDCFYPTQYTPQSQYYGQDWNNHLHSSPN